MAHQKLWLCREVEGANRVQLQTEQRRINYAAHREKIEVVKRREENKVAYLAIHLRLISCDLLNFCRSTFSNHTEQNVIKKAES